MIVIYFKCDCGRKRKRVNKKTEPCECGRERTADGREFICEWEVASNTIWVGQ